MSKIGRNDPCPCGSGKKHKKCCLLKTPAPALHLEPAERDASPMGAEHPPLPPAHDPFALASDTGPVWQREVLKGDSTAMLQARFGEVGIDAGAEAFAAAAAQVPGVWRLLEVWLEGLEAPIELPQIAVLEEAAWRLWQRHGLGRPCSEQVDEATDAAIEATFGSDVPAALTACERAWALLLARMDPEEQSGQGAVDALGLAWHPVAWLDELMNMIRDQDVGPGPELDRALALAEAQVARLPGDGVAIRTRTLGHLADLLGAAGRLGEMLTHAQALMAAFPAVSDGYMAAWMALGMDDDWPCPELVGRARGLLRAALQRPIVDAEWRSVERALEELDERAAELGMDDGPAPTPASTVMQALYQPGDVYRREALDGAVALGEALVPRLLQALDDLTACAEAVSRETYGHYYLAVLLAHLRVRQAEAPLLALLRVPEVHEEIWGEFALEPLGAVLHRVGAGDGGAALALLTDPDVDDAVRWGAAEAVFLAVASGGLAREEALEKIADALDGLHAAEHGPSRRRKGGEHAQTLIHAMSGLHPDRRRASLERALGGPGPGGHRAGAKMVDELLAPGLEAAMQRLTGRLEEAETDDVHAWLSTWDCFKPKAQPPARKGGLLRALAPISSAMRGKKKGKKKGKRK